jgi:cation transport regulator ChaC
MVALVADGLATRVIFVFGYGSLVSPESVGSTLGRRVDLENAELRGWQRAWNVGSDKESHPERTFRLADGTEFEGLTVVLGIEPGDRCTGWVFAVTDEDLALLDVRERNYDRTDVSDHVAWPSRPENCTIYAYTPKKTAIGKIATALESQRKINVRRGYVDIVGTSPAIPYPIEEMTQD